MSAAAPGRLFGEPGDLPLGRRTDDILAGY